MCREITYLSERDVHDSQIKYNKYCVFMHMNQLIDVIEIIIFNIRSTKRLENQAKTAETSVPSNLTNFLFPLTFLLV